MAPIVASYGMLEYIVPVHGPELGFFVYKMTYFSTRLFWLFVQESKAACINKAHSTLLGTSMNYCTACSLQDINITVDQSLTDYQ